MSASPSFELERPRSVEEALDLLAAHPDSRLLAGGQSLVPLMTMGLAAPAVVVSLDRCAGVTGIETESDRVTISAMVTTRRIELDPDIGIRIPLLAAAAARVGSPHVRNFATLVGNLCHADPGSDLIPAAVCLDADLEVRSNRGRRQMPVDELIDGPFTTSLRPGEMAMAVRIPVPDRSWRYRYRKLVKRAGDLALACAAVLIRVEDVTIVEARLAVGGPLRRAVRVRGLETELRDTPVIDAVDIVSGGGWIEELADGLLGDHTAPVDYLTVMLPRFLAATVHEAVMQADGTEP